MSKHFNGSKRDARALDTFVKLMRASESVHSDAVQGLSEHGLTPSQFAVLEALYHIGPMCLTEIARKILKTSGNLTMVVDNLEKRGLARRVKAVQDRRFVSVELTDAGRKLISSVFPPHAARIVERLSRLSSVEQEQLAALCRKLGREN
jgi:MarR family transcriptional regulator, 2-MHQ and catechol-resistance regulon repressor